MRTEDAGARFRRYVIGASTAAECEEVERDYFERAEVLDQVSAAEEGLIDDYLSGRLPQGEREQFERHYLASPNHRTRIAVVRALKAAASSDVSRRIENRNTATTTSTRFSKRLAGWTAVAASLTILVATAIWALRTDSGDIVAVRTPSSAPATAPPAGATPATPPTPSSVEPSRPSDSSPAVPDTRSPPPVVVAVTISPILVRSAGAQQTITIGKGTDIVRLRLRGQAGDRLTRGRSVIRTVTGREVWGGPVTATSALPRGELARVDVPASALPPDDYIIELIEVGADGGEVERHKYFLRVQGR